MLTHPQNNCFEYCEYISGELHLCQITGASEIMAAQNGYILDVPNKEESKLAAESGRVLATCSSSDDTVSLRLLDDATDIKVPANAIYMLADILNQMAQGNAVSIVSIHAELTTQQAAVILNVSRPYLIKKILDTGKLAYHKSGTRRKILYKDLIAYQNEDLKEREVVLTDLAEQGQEFGMME